MARKMFTQEQIMAENPYTLHVSTTQITFRGCTNRLNYYLTVESVNQGSMYVQSNEAVAAYGWIEKTVTWDDVNDPAVLMEKAKTYLTDLQLDNLELELSALDLHYLDVNTEAVKLLDEIRVISRPHGLDRMFPVKKLEIPLDNPEQTQFTLGDTVKTSLTDVMSLSLPKNGRGAQKDICCKVRKEIMPGGHIGKMRTTNRRR